MFVEVEPCSPTAKSIRDTILLTLAMLKLVEPLKMTSQTAIDERTIVSWFSNIHYGILLSPSLDRPGQTMEKLLSCTNNVQ